MDRAEIAALAVSHERVGVAVVVGPDVGGTEEAMRQAVKVQ
jgi:hypothetical protein